MAPEKKKSAVQHPVCVRDKQEIHTENVHGTRSSREKQHQKISVLHNETNGSGSPCRTDIMDDGINGKSLHEPSVLFRSERPDIAGTPGPAEAAAVDSFVEQKETVTFP